MRKWILTLLVLLFCRFFSGATDIQDLNNRMGNLYLEQARFLLENDEFRGAWEFVRRASEYIPESQKFLFLSTKVLLKLGQTGEALKAMEHQSRENGTFKKDWDRLRLPLLVQTKRYREVADIHQYWGNRVDWTSEELLHLAQASIGMGNVSGAVSLLEKALERYPQESFLLELLLRHSEGSRAFYRDKLLQGKLPSREREDEVLLLLLPLGEGEDFPPLWNIYQERGLFSLEGELRRGELFGWEGGPPWESLVGAGLFQDGLLTQRIHQWLLFNDDLAAFNRHFAGFSGTMAYDHNRDGWAEGEVSYKEGRVEEIHEDPNQDGIPEVSLILESGIPKSLSLNDQNIQVEYRSYPWVEEILHQTAEGSFRYRMGAERYSLPLKTWEAAFSPPAVEAELDWELLEEKALTISFQPPEKSTAIWNVENLWGEEGRISHPPRAQEEKRHVFTRNGSVYREERFLLGRDNPDTVVYYQEGMIREILHDADGDGFFEYREEYSEPTKPIYHTILWDLDGNGDADVEESFTAEGRMRRYFLGEAEDLIIRFPAGE